MSRSTLLFLLGGISIFSVCAWLIFGRETEITNIDSTGTDIIAFGDSLIEGVGATEGMALPDQLSRKWGRPVINAGVAGETTRDGLARIDTVLEDTHPRIIILSLGGNDFLKKIPRDETEKNLGRLIEKMQARGAMVMLLGVRSGIIGGGFDDEFEALSDRYGTLYVEDILSGIFGDSRFMSDPVHPNNQGYGIIADRIARAFEEREIVIR